MASIVMISAYSDGTPSISFAALDHQGNHFASRNPSMEYYAASTIKLAVLVAVMLKVDTGQLSLADPVLVAHQFPSRVLGAPKFAFDEAESDSSLPPSGQFIPLSLVVGRMIYASSNAATNMAIGLVGLPAVAEALALTGATRARMERLISDHEARDAGFTHVATPLDLARIMHSIVSGNICSEESTEFMLQQLRSQQFAVIGKAFPPSTVWGSKSGWVDGIHHDVAFVGEPGTPGSFVLAVCTRGFEHEQATAAIEAVAQAIGALVVKASPTGQMPT
jgi:beta-lactamase class A